VSFESGINDYNTIFIGPDGSKEGWPESKTADEAREDFLRFIKNHEYTDKSSPWAWVEVGYGDYGQKVLKGNNQNCYGNEEYAT
jgi:hypothetical protein